LRPVFAASLGQPRSQRDRADQEAGAGQGSPITGAKSKAEFNWFDTVKEWMWICASRDRS
jgi:hypothetical protein